MGRMGDLAGTREQEGITQSHLCAFLYAYNQCSCDEHCQYKLTTACYPIGPHFCGKDQILALDALQMISGEDRT